MLMPSIFGENLFNDDWMNFGFPEVEKALYGKHASHEMKTDVRETDSGYEVDIDLPGFKKDEINIQLDMDTFQSVPLRVLIRTSRTRKASISERNVMPAL